MVQTLFKYDSDMVEKVRAVGEDVKYYFEDFVRMGGTTTH